MNQVELLKALEHQSRISTQDLADLLNSSEDEIASTLTELEKSKVIVGYHTVINWDKTNHDQVMAIIEVSATPERDCGYDKIAANIAQYPEVSTLYLMSGTSEFIVEINGSTMREVADFVGQKLAPIEGIKGTSTYFVLKQYKVAGCIMDDKKESQKRLLVTP